MSTSANRVGELFKFSLPDYPEYTFGVTRAEIIEIGSVDSITKVPFAPHYVVGLAEWQERLITVVDLGRMLTDKSSNDKSNLGEDIKTQQKLVISQVAVSDKLLLIGWPIIDSGSFTSVSVLARKSEILHPFSSSLIHEVIEIDNVPIILLTLSGNSLWHSGK